MGLASSDRDPSPAELAEIEARKAELRPEKEAELAKGGSVLSFRHCHDGRRGYKRSGEKPAPPTAAAVARAAVHEFRRAAARIEQSPVSVPIPDPEPKWLTEPPKEKPAVGIREFVRGDAPRNGTATAEKLPKAKNSAEPSASPAVTTSRFGDCPRCGRLRSPYNGRCYTCKPSLPKGDKPIGRPPKAAAPAKAVALAAVAPPERPASRPVAVAPTPPDTPPSPRQRSPTWPWRSASSKPWTGSSPPAAPLCLTPSVPTWRP